MFSWTVFSLSLWLVLVTWCISSSGNFLFNEKIIFRAKNVYRTLVPSSTYFIRVSAYRSYSSYLIAFLLTWVTYYQPPTPTPILDPQYVPAVRSQSLPKGSPISYIFSYLLCVPILCIFLVSKAFSKWQPEPSSEKPDPSPADWLLAPPNHLIH